MPIVDYQKEPSVQVVGASPLELRRFLFGLTGTATVVAVLLIVASLYSNHYGYFGGTGQFGFYNDRLSKSDYLFAQEAKDLPEAYIIGSSNTMPFRTATVKALYGVSAFNLGSFWGRAEDIWAWSNFVVRDLGKKPKLVFIGVEPWTFADDNRGPPLLSMYQRRLITADSFSY
jgi:hypothetical protein